MVTQVETVLSMKEKAVKPYMSRKESIVHILTSHV